MKGKPYLAAPHDSTGLQFNITHSGGVVGVAIATGREIGLDIEWHNDRTSPERVAGRAFTAHEQASLRAMAPQHRRRHFFQLWTCKEALVKCTGLGIHSGMSAFQIALDSQGGARVSGAWGRQAGVDALRVVPLALGDGHAGAPTIDAFAAAAPRGGRVGWRLLHDPAAGGTSAGRRCSAS